MRFQTIKEFLMKSKEKMNIIAVVPARMGSSRFPGKPLADIHGVPMVGHVALRTAMCAMLQATYIATCDEVIMDYAASAGIQAVMTADTHTRCTDRTAEALTAIEKELGLTADIVVMVQGDEPMITPGMIEAAVAPMLADPGLQVVNLAAGMADESEFEDPSEVKVVTDLRGNALYFSREPVPSRKKGVSPVPMLKQVCVIPFRRDFLISFNAMPESPLEIIESVDMLRILENGGTVRMARITERTLSVDTPEDLERVRALMAGDTLRRLYSRG
jgi:3-deoxy-manno-octulosonate cytidylyltransferase (CMP-KDO synthetase)